MKLLLSTLPILAVLVLATGCAAPTRDTMPAEADQVSDSASEPFDADQPARAHNCIQYTGTRITTRDMEGRDCVAANGRVYTREDLRRTGEIDIADALRKLDPAIR